MSNPDIDNITKSFEKMGARVRFVFIDEPGRQKRSFVVDVKKDKKGEYFDLQTVEDIEILVLDCQPKEKHLLLLARDPNNPKAKFLCGHDERNWFTAAIPEDAGVSNVMEAKHALKPKELIDIEIKTGIKSKDLHKRKRKLKSGGKIYRQGEFMFMPKSEFQPTVDAVLKNEILSRGGNPHIAEYLYRCGGTQVYVCWKYRNGVKESTYKKILKENPKAKKWDWHIQVRDPDVYVKGKIKHPEHATINLGQIWHQVLLNTEGDAQASTNVAFID